MRVVEKTRHIDVTMTGQGAEVITALLKARMPEADFIDLDDTAVEWKETALAQEIKATKTPGKLVRAYRARAGMTLVQLAAAVGTQYPNLSAIENDRRAIGLDMAKKLARALGVEYQKFIA